MVRPIGLVVVFTTLGCGLTADAVAQSTAENAAKLDAKSVLDKVRHTYQNLPGYHLERVLLVQEAVSDGKPANIAELNLTMATGNAKPALEGRPSPAINLDRFRLGTRTKQGEMLQVCDGRSCWSYSAAKNEYMTGTKFMDVNTSVGGSVLMAFHLFTFSTLEEGLIQNAEIVRQEEVQVGKERRKCYVIEGAIQTAPLVGPSSSKKPPSPASLGPFWLVSMLSLQGLADGGKGTRYSPWLDEKTPEGAEPTRVTLWIDQNAHIILRSKMAAQLYKRTMGTEQAQKVAVTVTDRFTTAAVEAPPDDLFRFTPPEGAKEVPNAASRRDKKN